MKNKFLLEMQSRGYLNQCTDLDKLDEICDKNSISGYIGFDCTASSLHVGSLLQIMILKLMQKYGHQPIILLGGGTTFIEGSTGNINAGGRIHTTNITASGNISASGNVYAADYFDNGANINTLYAPVLGGDDNYVTDAEKTVIGNTSNTNSGDETTATVNALNITEVGALDDGTIAAGFGTINSAEITATSIKHSISGNNAGDYGPGAEILYGISDDSVTAGVIYDLRAGVWTPIDANGNQTYQHLCAVATAAAGSGNSSNGMIIKGCVTLASAYTDATGENEGILVYASETAGQATLVAPSDSGDIVRILGYSLNVSSKKMFFNPDSTYVEIA